MSAAKRPMTAEDLNQLIHMEEPRISPDGKWIVYVQVKPDPMEESYTRNLWLYSVESGKLRQLTRSGKDSQPRWSPDGKSLAFVSGRGKKPQIFLLSMNEPGEARQLTNALNGASSPAWSHDGQLIAYLARMNAAEREKEDSGENDPKPVDKLEGKHREERREEDEKRRWDPRLMERIPYRQGTSFLDDRFAQIYIIPTAEGLEGDAAKPRRLTSIDANHDAPSWSPDGTTLYTARVVDLEADIFWDRKKLFKVRVADGQAEVFPDDLGILAPEVSPDGKWIACHRLLHDATDALSRFSIVAADGSEIRVLNEALDREVSGSAWSPQGALIFLINNAGSMEAYAYHPAAGTTEKVVSGSLWIEGIDAGPDGMLAMAVSTPANPGELYTYAPDKGVQQVTQANQPFLDSVIVQEQHPLQAVSPNGEVLGWYLLPVGYEAGKKYPLALNIHGGPHIMWGPGMRSMWHEWQYHAASGYAVFYCNPRGADGHGQQFMRALHGAWGTVAMADILAGVDALLEKGFVDENRMAVTGGSYGGYMTAWIVSHTDRFKAAVSQRGVYNLLSFYGTSDVPNLISSEYDLHPWDNPTLLWQESPLAHAHKIKTPLLIIHSENDFRVPIEQGEQLFAYLRRSGNTPVKMLRFPREGHELSRNGEPKHRIRRLTEMVNWFDQYCKPAK